jgi:hypothetical protein
MTHIEQLIADGRGDNDLSVLIDTLGPDLKRSDRSGE